MLVVLLLFTALCAADGLSLKSSELPSIEELNKALEKSVSLPLQSQKAVLKEIGEVLRTSSGKCNIFAGKDSCVELPGGTELERICRPYSNRTVDCAFEFEALGAAQNNPYQRIQKEGYTGCQECSAALQHFWCAQSTPACGTFDHIVDELLPYVGAISAKKLSALTALKDSVPRIFQAASLGLPCRKLCQAITNTCGCGRSQTFGEVIRQLEKGSESDAFNVTISASTAKEVFANIWHTPVCDLFSEEDTPGFYGTCEHTSDSTRCEWCHKSKPHVTIFYEQVVIQLSQMFYGVMQGGLHQVLRAAAGGKGALQDNWSQSLYGGDREVSESHHTGAVLLLFVLLVLAVGGFVAALKTQRHREIPSQYIDLNSLGYTPPVL